MTITTAALLAEGTRRLALAGLDCARQDALRLMAQALGIERLAVYVEPRRSVDARAAASFRALVDRRAAHEPVQHIQGYEEFRGLRIAVTPDVLIPRLETEGLVERALELLADKPGALVADIGTGSGAIACGLAVARPDLEVLAVDQSLGALAVASDNVRALGLGSRVRLLAGDLFGPLASLPASLDMVVANPPYCPSGVIPTLPVEVERFEPRLALDGGPDGMRVLRRIITEAPRFLRAGAWLLMEIGEEQAGPLASLMAAEGFSRIGARRDLRDVERYIEGRWAEGAASVPLTGMAAQRVGC
ncbi:MAG: peptide chain release factor N(5)-glutamine methyltransferase [Candidatus Rokubacteria bacterium]|nr:peptide chain release factor N(5)-glutamine methyltransferase [Candidatus Rokubacteria bacterium]